MRWELIRTMLGPRLIDRWEMWEPSIGAIGGRAAYPMFANLVTKMRAVGAWPEDSTRSALSGDA